MLIHLRIELISLSFRMDLTSILELKLITDVRVVVVVIVVIIFTTCY